MEAPNYISKEEVPESLLRPGIDDPARCCPGGAVAWGTVGGGLGMGEGRLGACRVSTCCMRQLQQPWAAAA